MQVKQLDPAHLAQGEDWQGDNAAFTCPHCGKVLIVSGSRVHRGKRACPGCGRSTGYCDIKGAANGGKPRLES